MKVLKKQVKNCEESNGEEVVVLELHYSHRGKKGMILVRDYEESMYEYILKQLRIKVRDAYNNFQAEKALAK